ncbi:MAG: FAD-binding oxidoreductase [Streptosporangiaceae bacterium]|nr:FAD-binding oxidoreductase [Streptosporangiaceae bacterium]
MASPSDIEEASALLADAAASGLAVVPRGAGTGLSWGPPPSACDLVVDMRRMDQVVEHAAGDLVAKVQAGASMGHVASVLAEAGQQLALDAPAGATVGGVVATGTAGPRRFRYGAPRDLLIGITAVRADGIIAHSGGRVVKNVAGYDLGKLLAGSQGTLALITEATFRLHPLPPAAAYLTAEFAPADRAAAVAAVTAAARSALVPSAVELDWPGSDPGTLRVGVLLEGTESGVAARTEQMSLLLAADGGSPGVAVGDSPPPWWGRLPPSGPLPGGPGGLGGRASPQDQGGSGGDRPPEGNAASSPQAGTVVRVSFWVARLAEALDAVEACGAEADLRPAVTGPAGVGLLYACLGPDAGGDAVARFVTVLRGRLAGSPPRGSVVVLAGPVLAAGGLDALGQVPGTALMRAVKDQFDPGNRMFPGRVFGGG